MIIRTIGHSTRTLDELVAVLQGHKIETLADVRSFPASRRHPHFNRENLETTLPQAGIRYHWLGKTLGGYRKSTRKDSPHIALQSASFRAYADHMETEAFRQGVEALLALAGMQRTVYMCAEKLWWRCHRRFISDCLVGIKQAEVLHLIDEKRTGPHSINPLARKEGVHLIYDRGVTPSLL